MLSPIVLLILAIAVWLVVGPTRIRHAVRMRKEGFEHYVEAHPAAKRQIRLARICGGVGFVALLGGLTYSLEDSGVLGNVAAGIGAALLLVHFIVLLRHEIAADKWGSGGSAPR